jgi:hypothetical protein
MARLAQYLQVAPLILPPVEGQPRCPPSAVVLVTLRQYTVQFKSRLSAALGTSITQHSEQGCPAFLRIFIGSRHLRRADYRLHPLLSCHQNWLHYPGTLYATQHQSCHPPSGGGSSSRPHASGCFGMKLAVQATSVPELVLDGGVLAGMKLAVGSRNRARLGCIGWHEACCASNIRARVSA